jgi:hypothetical protein
MPRRLPLRPAKIIGNLFVVFVMTVISLIYYTFVFIVWGPRTVGKPFFMLNQTLDNFPVMILLAFFHLFFILLIWSFFQAMTTDPGQVPVFWVIICSLILRDFIWEILRTKDVDIVSCAMCLSLRDVTIAQLVIVVF